MTRQVRRIAAVLFLLFGALFVNLNFLQVLRADNLSNDNRNSRKIIAEYSIRRGSIVAEGGRDTIVLAESVATDGERFKYRRRYPEPELYAHVTGFYSLLYGRTGLEDTANGFLVGDAPEQFARNVGDLLTGREPEGDDVVVTLRPEVQRAAREALGDRVGAVVALEPTTGAVLALWANPSYDPNRLATFDRDRAVRYWERSENERRSCALRETYPPGSTFKVITAAAALEDGIDPDDTFDDPSGFTPPQTTTAIPNFGGGLCNGGSPITLARAFEVSCNTTFAQLGVDVGADLLVEQAEAFGFNETFDLDLPMAASAIPAELDPPSTAQSAIGQRDVRATPLQMAMVSAAVANDGVLMRPHVVARVEDFAGRVVRETTPSMLVLDGQD
ncbi:MAG: penicillin-binding transpeptidase domain-containing protein, partial [Actinomycetota bacterium]|nr:penicillin-binding transpeptidase domain-containing protein [Actinomycetota bacterium]